jgi:hypothetical protein
VDARATENAIAAELEPLRASIERYILADTEHVLVRSDGPAEHTLPGARRSLVLPSTWQAVVNGVARLAADYGSWPLVQRAIEPAMLGAASNARRMSPRPRSWVIEGPLDLASAQVATVEAAADPRPAEPLTATSIAKLLPTMARVAAALNATEQRMTCEWLWDGNRVWLVQADPLADSDTEPEAQRLLDDSAAPVWLPTGTALEGDWSGPKTYSRKRFQAHLWPTVPMVARRAEHFRESASRRQLLRRELARHDAPLVVRVDAGRPERAARPLLPTSAPSRRLDALDAFIREALDDVARQGIPLANCGILISPLVPARVSVLARAQPRSNRVVLNALWGFPDGLLTLPHDRYWVTEQDLAADIRHKPACLVLAEGVRRQVRLGDPWDWQATLNDHEVRVIAGWTRMLADEDDRPLHLMCLARVSGIRGAAGLLPFHVLQHDIHDAGGRPARPPRGKSVVVHSLADVASLDDSAAVLRLEPDLDVARDAEFYAAVARAAVDADIPIMFAGSLLGHARSALVQSGAVVVSPDEDAPVSNDRPFEVPVIASTHSGLARIRLVPTDQAAELTADAHRQGRGALKPIPWLSAKSAATLTPVLDRPGEPGRFLDDSSSLK